MRRSRHCIFDLYGTLVDIRTDETAPQLWETVALWYRTNGAAYAPETIQARYIALIREQEREYRRSGDQSEDAHPEIRLEMVFQQLFLDAGVPADSKLIERTGALFRRTSLRHIGLYDGAIALLQSLRQSGWGVWLLSNAQRLFTEPELRHLGLTPCFDGIYLSSDYGFKKPDSHFFRALLDERHIDPASAVMVGNDGLCDILPARRLGLATVYIRSNISPDEPVPPADYTLDHVDLCRVQTVLEAMFER